MQVALEWFDGSEGVYEVDERDDAWKLVLQLEDDSGTSIVRGWIDGEPWFDIAGSD
jgi:hypothetical protein